ncbi:chloroplast beta-amylase [Actinidia rufa]|uniref:Beta-amylase n=1 Tax=Actinidia rufa TaxID=165716 RepID=A0A7J0GX24_9ERIC|nr:chloroplast beta-amylase [Actinidia rufa]
MALTLRSSTSFTKLKDIRCFKTLDDFSGMVCFAQIRPSCRLRAKSLMQETQFSREKTLNLEDRRNEKWEKLHKLSDTHGKNASQVPVFCDAATRHHLEWGELEQATSNERQLDGLKKCRNRRRNGRRLVGIGRKRRANEVYNWEGYAELVKMAQKLGLKLQVVMSFSSVRRKCWRLLQEIQVGMGPCGELRYPSYPESNGTWRFPGIEAIGKEDWGISGPHDTGQYNQFLEDTTFLRRDGTWNNDYGQFFLEWYLGMLLEHGDRILAAANRIFQGTGAKLSGKVAGIHWHCRTRSHAAESLLPDTTTRGIKTVTYQ